MLIFTLSIASSGIIQLRIVYLKLRKLVQLL